MVDFQIGDIVRAAVDDPEQFFMCNQRYTVADVNGVGPDARLTLGFGPGAFTAPAHRFDLVHRLTPISEAGWETPTPRSAQIGGDHYARHEIQPWDALKCWLDGMEPFAAYMTGNAIKYLARWHNKGGVEDLKKARHYIDALIAELDHQP